MAKNLRNEFSVRMAGNKAILTSHIEEELDAQEFLMQMTQLETQIDQLEANKELRKNNLAKYEPYKEQIQQIRKEEIEAARKERDEAEEKQNTVKPKKTG